MLHERAQVNKTNQKKVIQEESRAIIRQITSSVTFLPVLDEPCSFDVLVYANHDVQVPELWKETHPMYVTDAEEIKLRSFSTRIHKVDTMVSYKPRDEFYDEADEKQGS